MKRAIFFISCCLFLTGNILAQTSVFHENFEPPTFADSVTSTQTIAGIDDWGLSNVLSVSGLYSDSCSVILASTAYLTTDPFSTLGKFVVHLDFEQICKIDFLDLAKIEISVDNGGNWNVLPDSIYLGASTTYGAFGDRFASSSYANDWQPGDAAAIPDNSWWKHEKFDISFYAGDQANVIIRFMLQDGSTPGSGGNYGWLIDDIVVRAAVSELDPPVITMIPPIYTGNVYNLGPFNVRAEITDASGIDNAYLVYNVNDGLNDTLGMTIALGDTFQASIPVVNHLDTICYHIVALDGSVSKNMAIEPVGSCNKFVASSGIIIPYYNSLDWPGSLTDFIITGSTYGRAHHNAAAANTGAGGMIMDASAQTNWLITFPDTIPGSASYIWDPSVNDSHYANARLTLYSQGYTSLFLKFDLKQLFYSNNLYTHFRVVVNGTMITPHFTPKGSTSKYNTYEFDLSQFLPATSLVIDFESKARYPFTGTTTNGSFIDNILVDVPPAQEAYLIDIIEPNGGCGLGNESVTIRIKNKGTDPIIGNMTANYFLVGSSTTVTEPMTNIILPADTTTFTFNTLVDVSVGLVDSTYELVSYIDLVGDPYYDNDTANISVLSAHVPPDPLVANATIPYGTYTTLSAVSLDSIYWFDIPAGGKEIFKGPHYTTPILYDTTVYYVEARSGIGELKITECLQFKTGSGYTNPYPPYCPTADWDGLEIANLGSAPIDLTDYTINLDGTNSLSWTVPAGVILNAGDVMVLSYNGTSAVASPPDNFYVMSTNYSSGSATAMGYFIKDPTGLVIDACALNSYQFSVASGVTSADWSGNMPSSSGNAGIVRISSDNNTASDWSISSQTPQSIGAMNPSLAGIVAGGNGCPSNRVADTVFVGGAPPYDASVVEIQTPVTNFNLSAVEPVRIKVKNYGTLPISGFDISYTINNGTPQTDFISATVNPGDTLIHVFSASANLFSYGTYDFKAYLNISGDLNQLNDTAYSTVENKQHIYCPSNATSTLYSDIGNVTISNLNNGIATPVFTNPTAINQYTDFTYLQPVQLTIGNTYPASVSQIFSSANFYVSFIKIYIDLNIDGTFDETTEQVFGQVTSNPGTTVTANINIPLNAKPGRSTMRVVMEQTTIGTNVFACGTYSYGETEDYQVMIAPPIPNDAGVISILQPNAIETQGYHSPVKVIVKNFGTDPITFMSIAYDLNYGAPVIQPYIGSLAPGFTDTVTLASFYVPPLDNLICAYTMLAGDSNAFNNHRCKNFYGDPLFNAEAVSIISPKQGCGLGDETVTIKIHNTGINTINGNIDASYFVVGAAGSVTEAVTASIAPGDTIDFSFVATIDMSTTLVDSTFEVFAWVDLMGDPINNNDTTDLTVLSAHIPPDPGVVNANIPFGSNITLQATSLDSIFWFDIPVGGVEIEEGPFFTTPILYGTTVYWVEARSGIGDIKITEVTQFTTGTGHTPIYPPDVVANWDGFELSNLGTAPMDLSDYTLHVEGTQTLDYTIPNGVMLNANEVALFTIYGNGAVDNPANNFYVISTTNSTGSTSKVGYIIKDPTGKVIDAVATNGYQFSATSGVTMADWSGNIAFSSAGVSRITSDNNLATDWMVATAAIPQTIGTLNPGLASAGGNGCASNRVPDTVFVGGVPPYDVSVVKILEPVTDFNLTNSEIVKIKVKNYGIQPVSYFPVSYVIGNGTPITDTIYANLNQGDTLIHVFSQNANLATFGIYNFKAYLSYPGDNTPLNDTAYASIENKMLIFCPSHATTPTSYEDIGNVTISNLNNGYPLPVLSNPTATNGYSDFTGLPPVLLAPGATYFTSISQISASTSTSSCTINVYIDYNRDGIFDPITENAFGGVTSATSTTIAGNAVIPVTAKQGLTVMRVVLDRYTNALPCGTYTYGETEDYLVMMAPLIPQDAGVIEIVQPFALYDEGDNVPVEVKIQNFGTNPINYIEIAYEVNGGPPVIHPHTSMIPPGTVLDLMLPDHKMLAGDNFICAYTILAGDSNDFNDGRCTRTFGEHTTSPPYFDNFDGSTNLWWPDSVPTQWERGEPAANIISYPYTGPNVWATDLDDIYESNTYSFLYSPKFNVLSAIGVDSLFFWHFMHAQNGDGGNIQYLSTSGWRILGMENDTNAVNWYNTMQNIWTDMGSGPGYKLSAYDLKSVQDFAAITQFRFTFYGNSATNTNRDGWAIDNFRITTPKIARDGGVVTIIEPVGPIVKGTNIQVKVRVKNHGLNPLDTIPVLYKINSLGSVQANWMNGPLKPDSTFVYTFPSINAPAKTFSLCAYTNVTHDTYLFNDGICDSIKVIPPNKDAGLQRIEYPLSQTVYGMDTTIAVWIKNYGKDTIKSTEIEYSAASIVGATETWTGNLAPGDSMLYVFNSKFNHPYVGYFYLLVYTKLSGDGYLQNDSIKIILESYFSDLDENMLEGFSLEQNIPNPTDGITTIRYTVPSNGDMKFTLVNYLGQMMETRSEAVMAGEHRIELNVSDLPSGVYFYYVEYDNYRIIKKMVVNK